MLDYLDRNRFDEVYKGPGDNFFGTLSASRPEIYPIYWSQAQMQARQSEEMANAQSFLNRLWTFESDGKQWFNPDVSVIYPDRIRRRPPERPPKVLERIPTPGHWNAGCFQRISAFSPTSLMAIWRNMIHGMRHIVRKLKSTRWTTPPNVPCFGHSRAGQRSLICCWSGGCCVVPIPEAMAYVLLRPLLDDVPEDELCGVAPGRVLPVSEQWHPLLIEALTSIPKLEAGDSVWWHCDVIHSVAPVENQQGWGNVMYIPAAPMCEKILPTRTR